MISFMRISMQVKFISRVSKTILFLKIADKEFIVLSYILNKHFSLKSSILRRSLTKRFILQYKKIGNKKLTY